MKDDRLRIRVDDNYIEALGRAAYVFATLEWNAVWCCQRLTPGYVYKLTKEPAGKVADDLLECVAKIDDALLKQECEIPAREFKRLVPVRNSIFHAKPATSEDGKQRLFRNGVFLEPEMINEAADEFAACSMLFSSLLHGRLKEPAS